MHNNTAALTSVLAALNCSAYKSANTKSHKLTDATANYIAQN